MRTRDNSRAVEEISTDPCVQALRRLRDFFGKNLTGEAMEFYVQEFRFFPDNVFNRAVSEAMKTERTFPTVTVLKNYVIEARNAMEKRKFRGGSQVLAELGREKAGDADCIKESRRILQRIALLEGHPQALHGLDLVAEMRAMEHAYPGRGWGEAGNELAVDIARIRENKRKFIAGEIYSHVGRRHIFDERSVEVPARQERQFANVHEKAEYYRKLFSGEAPAERKTEDV